MNHVGKVLGFALLAIGSTGMALAVPAAAPEIDPGTAGSAIALVSGMLLLARARRK
jgi:hypothetical protein